MDFLFLLMNLHEPGIQVQFDTIAAQMLNQNNSLKLKQSLIYITNC